MSNVTVVPYPTAQRVMNRARAFVNDAFRGGAGRILTNAAPFTVEYLNGAFEELQDKIGNNGVITLEKDNVILTPIPAIASQDPAARVLVAYTGTYNGVAWSQTPFLPGDCVSPKKLWMRLTGSNLPFQEMTQSREGLGDQFPNNQFLTMWEYLTDQIVLLGATAPCDLRLRYELRQPVIATETPENQWSDVSINILASVNALATVVAYLYARARGAQAAPQLQTDGKEMMRYIVRRYTRRAQSVPYRRPAYDDGVSSSGGINGSTLPF
jgi:hypothetical protein